MRKRITIISLLILLFVVPVMLFAADSSVTQELYRIGNLYRLELSWTANATGSVEGISTKQINGTIYGVETDPGTTAPTNSYDITLKDQYGLDIMGGALEDRSAEGTQFIQPYNATQGTYISMPNHGALDFSLSNNVVDSATGKTVIYYYGG